MEEWLPIVEYAAKKRISISTVRRYIKANRVQFKQDNGKYFILFTEQNQIMEEHIPQKIRDLEAEIHSLESEKADLRMFLDLLMRFALHH